MLSTKFFLFFCLIICIATAIKNGDYEADRGGLPTREYNAVFNTETNEPESETETEEPESETETETEPEPDPDSLEDRTAMVIVLSCLLVVSVLLEIFKECVEHHMPESLNAVVGALWGGLFLVFYSS